jgi:hypothetical protein
MRVLRGMIPDDDGLPRVGSTGRTLGARPGYPDDPEESGPDIRVDEDGTVYPETGGASVAIPPVENLPPHRRPPKHGGRGKKLEVYELETDGLPDELRARIDPFGPTAHAFIEPAYEMCFDEYQHALHSTRELWSIVR